MSTIKIAITGNIGSGKSTFADYITSKGYPVLNADIISKKILSSDKEVKSQVMNEFGSDSFSGNNVNKEFLAEKVFSNPEKLNKLNSILHPKVFSSIDSIIVSKYAKDNIVFVEAALIFETGTEKKFDYIVLITADDEIRLQRSIAANKFTEEEFKLRESNQIPQELKIKYADFIFSNNGSEKDLFNKAEFLLSTLKKL